MLETLRAQASEAGWASMVVAEFNPQSGSIKVVMQDNAFEPFCLRMHMPQCFFLRGYLSGIIKELSNVDYMFSDSDARALCPWRRAMLDTINRSELVRFEYLLRWLQRFVFTDSIQLL